MGGGGGFTNQPPLDRGKQTTFAYLFCLLVLRSLTCSNFPLFLIFLCLMPDVSGCVHGGGGFYKQPPLGSGKANNFCLLVLLTCLSCTRIPLPRMWKILRKEKKQGVRVPLPVLSDFFRAGAWRGITVYKNTRVEKSCIRQCCDVCKKI